MLYARVSTNSQKKDLQKQIEILETYAIANGYQFEVITDIASGINCSRKGFNKVLEMIEHQEIERIVVNCQDRLLRFGFEMFMKICELHNVVVEIINQTKDKTFECELADDLISLVTVFSARLYGKRSHKNKKLLSSLKGIVNEKDNQKS